MHDGACCLSFVEASNTSKAISHFSGKPNVATAVFLKSDTVAGTGMRLDLAILSSTNNEATMNFPLPADAEVPLASDAPGSGIPPSSAGMVNVNNDGGESFFLFKLINFDALLRRFSHIAKNVPGCLRIDVGILASGFDPVNQHTSLTNASRHATLPF